MTELLDNEVAISDGKIKKNDDSNKPHNSILNADKGNINIDLSSLGNVINDKIQVENLKINFQKQQVVQTKKQEELHTTVEELAEDMVHLFKKIGEIEEKSIESNLAIMKLQALVEASTRSLIMEISQIKDSLLSDRKEIVSRSTFNALMPAIESLQDMKRHYDETSGDLPSVRNTQSILDILNGILQALHYHAFESTPGDPFDPYSMECTGYEKGDEGRVVKIERPGYRSGSVLVRPCAVILGKAIMNLKQ